MVQALRIGASSSDVEVSALLQLPHVFSEEDGEGSVVNGLVLVQSKGGMGQT